MKPLEGNDFTLVELKDALRERGLPTKGVKAELIQRLNELDSNIWKILSEKSNKVPEEGTSLAVVQETTDEQMDPEDDVSIHERGLEDTPVLPREQNYLQQELELCRRERELLERERQLLRREREMTHSASITSSVTSTIGSVRNIKDLLPEFDAIDNTFWRGKNQLELLRNVYQLDDNATKVLISSRLKGRALTWFYSKAEYLTLNVENLLEEMQQLFDLRPGKLLLRKEFEARTWKTGEPFCDYYHEKMILANRVPIAEDELLDYLVEGVTDIRLQNQARIMNFKSGMELLKAFEKINLEPKKYSDSKRKDSAKPSSPKPELSPAKGKLTKCYKCRETGHVATQCQRPAAPVTKRACYVCGSSEHLAKDYSERKQTAETGGKSAQTTSTNVIQPAALPEPYMVSLRINAIGKCGNINTCMVDAIIAQNRQLALFVIALLKAKLIRQMKTLVNFVE